MILADFAPRYTAEEWSQKYKRSINCAHPKGFSQRAHGQGRKKNEDQTRYSKKSINDKFVYKFLPWLQRELKIKKLPKIELLDKPITTSFGMYDDATNTLYLVTEGRHPVDVLRTLAHELVHYKQHLDGKLYPGAGETGTPEENEANAGAGIILRQFGQTNPEYFGIK
jgi:hypothetical protein